MSGYTEFLTTSELEHAHEIMREIMTVLSRALGYPLLILKYEGDAVLCCATDSSLRDPTLLLDLLEQSYLAFADHLFNMQRATTCTCRACQNIGSLDLKFFVHHGQFILEEQGKGKDISGPDVILLHRLMKNSVSEKTGLRAYILATKAALERLGNPADFTSHEESYEHFGTVACGVANLQTALEARRAARQIRVSPERTTLICERTVEATPILIWDYFLDPVKRLGWDASIIGLERQSNDGGRAGVGAKLHCAHGQFKSVATMVDWKPFDYFTQEYISAGGFMAPMPMLMSVETEPLEDGRTRVRQLFELRSRNPLMRLMVWLMRKQIEAQGNTDLEHLDELIRTDLTPR